MTCTLRSALIEKHSRKGRRQAKERSCKLQRCSLPQRLPSLSVISVHGLVFGHLIPRWSELTSSMACKARSTSESAMFQADPSRRAGCFARPAGKCVDCSYEFSKSCQLLGSRRFSCSLHPKHDLSMWSLGQPRQCTCRPFIKRAVAGCRGKATCESTPHFPATCSCSKKAWQEWHSATHKSGAI